MKKWQFKKSTILYAAELLIILVLVLGSLFGKEEEVFRASSGDVFGALTQESGQQMWHSGDMQLKPGVYRIDVRGSIPEGVYLTVALESRETKVFREIMANSVAMRGNSAQFQQQVTVSAGLDAAYLRIVFYGDAAGIALDSVTLTRTSGMYSVLAVCALILMSLVNLLLYFHRLIAEKKISGEQQMVVWVLAATVLLAMFPYLTDYITVGEGANYYLNRIGKVRYFPFEGGSFLGDLCLLLPAILRMLGFTVQKSWQLFLFAITIVTALLTYHCLKSCAEDRKAALLGTMLYVLFPYRIHGFFNSGNLAEGIAMIFLPPVVCGGYLLLAKRRSKHGLKTAVICLVAGVGCLLPVCVLSATSAAVVKADGGVVANVAFSPQSFWAVVSALGALGVCLWLKRLQDGVRQGVTILLSVLVLGIAIYQVNDIAFNMAPTYLYNMETSVDDGGIE